MLMWMGGFGNWADTMVCPYEGKVPKTNKCQSRTINLPARILMRGDEDMGGTKVDLYQANRGSIGEDWAGGIGGKFFTQKKKGSFKKLPYIIHPLINIKVYHIKVIGIQSPGVNKESIPAVLTVRQKKSR